MRSAVSAAVLLAGLLAFGGGLGAQTTDLLLVLAADVSRSIDESEFALQRKGYSAALTDPRVLAAIRGGTTGTIAICFVEWSGAGEQNVVADWTVIRDEEDAGGLAAAILAAPRSFIGRTSISGAIDFAMERFTAAQPRASRHIIDISGDGSNSNGRSVIRARDEAVAADVNINGLPILAWEPYLDQYYKANVIGGPGAFMIVATDFNTFADAILKKMITEIAMNVRPRPTRIGKR